jgi:hypothetical protein
MSTDRVPPPISSKAWQRQQLEKQAWEDQRLSLADIRSCRVEAVPRDEAKVFILRYEWLGTMGRSRATYGLRAPDGELIGAAVFGWPASPESRDICGRQHRDRAVCLERGACAPHAPLNAASFLISRATAMAAADHGWSIFYAYADPEAGEIGTVYQACNWLYLGQGIGRDGKHRLRQDWMIPEENNKVIASRSLRHRGVTINQAKERGWIPVYKHPKHKYCTFEGPRAQRRGLLRDLRYPVQPYPKR